MPSTLQSAPRRAPLLLATLAAAALGTAALAQTPGAQTPAVPAPAAPADTAAPAAKPVPLAPHRAIYELALDLSRGAKGVEAARGRIVYEFSGGACEGFATSFRQLTELQGGEIGTRRSDARSTSFEDGEGRLLRFQSDTRIGERLEGAQGRASLADGTLSIALTKPEAAQVKLPGEVDFPTAHLSRILRSARGGESLVERRVFDGADDGRKVYDTTTVIGRRYEPGRAEGVEEAARAPSLKDLPSWPVTVSYFEAGTGERTPAYVMSYVLYDNGVARTLRLDYGDFSLKGELSRLEPLKAPACGE